MKSFWSWMAYISDYTSCNLLWKKNQKKSITYNRFCIQRLIIVIVLVVLIKVVWFLNLDKTIATFVNSWQHQGIGLWWGKIAYWLGLGELQIILIGVISFWGRLNGHMIIWRQGMSILIAILAAGIGVQIIKHLAGRPRPRMHLPIGEYFGPTLQNDLHSFPSGHATTSFTLAVVLSIFWPRQSWIFYLAAIIVCIGRLISGSHYLSDVLVGALLGLVIGWFFVKYFLLPKKQ